MLLDLVYLLFIRGGTDRCSNAESEITDTCVVSGDQMSSHLSVGESGVFIEELS